MAAENLQKRLSGTKTEKNLKDAFAGESQARNRYTYFADTARDEGYEAIADVFVESASNEREHAEVWFEFLGGIGTTEQNLLSSISGEDYEATDMYKRMAREAREEGFDEIARKFDLVAGIEATHAARFTKWLQELRSGQLFRSDKPVTWVCLNCGYQTEAKDAPLVCPFCGFPQGYFERVCKE